MCSESDSLELLPWARSVPFPRAAGYSSEVSIALVWVVSPRGVGDVSRRVAKRTRNGARTMRGSMIGAPIDEGAEDVMSARPMSPEDNPPNMRFPLAVLAPPRSATQIEPGMAPPEWNSALPVPAADWLLPAYRVLGHSARRRKCGRCSSRQHSLSHRVASVSQ